MWGGGACTMTHLRESQGTYRREFSAPTVWGVGIKLGPSGLAVIASLPWAISPVLDFSFWGAGMQCSRYTNALPLSHCRILVSILLFYGVSKVWYTLIYLVCAHGRHGSHMEARGQEETLLTSVLLSTVESWGSSEVISRGHKGLYSNSQLLVRLCFIIQFLFTFILSLMLSLFNMHSFTHSFMYSLTGFLNFSVYSFIHVLHSRFSE